MQASNPGLGTVLAVSSGILLGTFAAPMKRIRGWSWENTWLGYCFWSLIVFAWLFGFATVPGLVPLLLAAPVGALLPVLLYGAGWGAGCVIFGLALDLSGLALGTAIVLGLNNALGALLPVALLHPQQFRTTSGITLASGVGVMLVGVGLCAWAGSAKQSSWEAGNELKDKGRVRKGVLLAIVAGVLATMFNFALIAGDALRQAAESAGARPSYANNAVWCVSLLGGFVTNAVYCGYLLIRNGSWRSFAQREPWRNCMLTLVMGGMWMGGVAVYGAAVSHLGHLGPSVGWALIQSTAVMAGSVVGLITGEWRDAGVGFCARMLSGLAVLLAGMGLVSASAFV